MIEVIDLHRNKVELEKLQDKEVEENDPETYFTVCLEDGMILKIKGDSVSNGICGMFTITDEDDNVVFKTNPSNIQWWGRLDCMEPVVTRGCVDDENY